MPRAIWNVRINPIAADPVRPPVRDLVAIEHDVAGVGRHKPGDAVEQCGLARTVGADQAGDAMRLDLKVDAVERLHAVEAARNLMTTEEGHRAIPEGDF